MDGWEPLRDVRAKASQKASLASSPNDELEEDGAEQERRRWQLVATHGTPAEEDDATVDRE